MAEAVAVKKDWWSAFISYFTPRMLIILIMGFASGLPLLLTLSTLSYWLSKVGVDKTTIGLFALVGTPYTFKFLWSPIMDQVPLPVLTRMLGRRRSWLLLTQVLLAVAILFMGQTDPVVDPWMTALAALIVAFLSASQDIVIDAYRVESLETWQQGAGAGAIQLGYRIGMWAAGAGALALSAYLDWASVYAVMAALVLVGVVTILVNPEPAIGHVPPPTELERRGLEFLRRRSHWPQAAAKAALRLYTAVVCPFLDFMRHRGWLAILLFVLLFKFGEALLGVMAFPFYYRTGFTEQEIALVSKTFGVGVTLVGGLIGGLLVGKMGIVKTLVIGGVLQMLSNLMFALQAIAGHDVPMLMVTITVENLSGGIASASFVAYLSSLCNVAYTATQYALLSALGTASLNVLAAAGGWVAEQMDWVSFFIVTTFAAAPGLVVLLWMIRAFPPREPAVQASKAGQTQLGRLGARRARP
jgi:PAT family beta-lactamase induction signal transducer AmpG